MSNPDEDDVKVVVEQTLLKTEEVFVYRVPPMMTSGGHHADDWDLANPVATCSLQVIQRDSSLLIKLLAEKPKPNGPPGATDKYLFAQSKIMIDLSSSSVSKSKLTMGHWVEAVTDSSRYFVIRISDEKRKKEAHVGIGFRERNDALNFKMSLQDYENSMRKEAMISESVKTNTSNDSLVAASESSDLDTADDNGCVVESVSKLSLKDGEKIHINLKGSSTRSSRTKKSSTSNASTSDKPPLLLRKPPSPASSSVVNSSPVVVNTDALRLSQSYDRGHGASSVAAIAEVETNDDEWGEFESPSFDTE